MGEPERLTAKQLANLPWLHIYSQWNPHRPATVFGSRSGLIALRDALNAAIDSGAAEAHVFATDGEGYPVHVTRAYRSGMPDPQYLDTVALKNLRDHDRWTAVWRRQREAAPLPPPASMPQGEAGTMTSISNETAENMGERNG